MNARSGPGTEAHRSATFVLFYPDFIPRHRLMARALADAGWNVRLVCWDRGDAAMPPQAEDWVAGRHAVRVAAPSATLVLLFKLPFLFAGILRALRGEPAPDVLFLTHYALLPLAPFLRGRTGALIYDAPDYFCEDLLRYFGPLAPLMRPLLRAFERLCVVCVDAITTIDSYRGWLAEYYRRMRRPVLVVWNVPALADDAESVAVTEAAMELDRAPVVAYVGGIKPGKGLDAMLGAIAPVQARHPDAKFLFIGSPQEPVAAFEGRLRRAGGGALFRPAMPYRQMLSWLRASRIGLALLERGRNDLAGAGNCRKIFTYMQAGLPIVATDVGSVGAFVREQDCGSIVDPDRPEQVVEAVGKYLADPPLAKKHGANGRRAFAERFNWEAQSGAFTGFVAGTVRA